MDTDLLDLSAVDTKKNDPDLLHHKVDSPNDLTDSPTICSIGIKRQYTSDDVKEETIAKKCLIVDYENLVNTNNFSELEFNHPPALPLLFSRSSELEIQDAFKLTETCCDKSSISLLASRCNNTAEDSCSEYSREVVTVCEFSDELAYENVVKSAAFCVSTSNILNINISKNSQNHSFATIGHDIISCKKYNVPTGTFDDTNGKNDKYEYNADNSLPQVSFGKDDKPTISLSHSINSCSSALASTFPRLCPEISLSMVTIPLRDISSVTPAIELCSERLSNLAAVTPEYSQPKDKRFSMTIDSQTDIPHNFINCINSRFIDKASCATNENITFPHNSDPDERVMSCTEIDQCHQNLFDKTLNSSHKHNEYLVKSALTKDNLIDELYSFQDVYREDNDIKEDKATNHQDNVARQEKDGIKNDELLVVNNVELPSTANVILGNENNISRIIDSFVNLQDFNDSGSNINQKLTSAPELSRCNVSEQHMVENNIVNPHDSNSISADPICTDKNISLDDHTSELRHDALSADEGYTSSNKIILVETNSPESEPIPPIIDNMSKQVEETRNMSVKSFDENHFMGSLEIESKDGGSFLTENSRRETINEESPLNLVMRKRDNTQSHLKDNDADTLSDNKFKLGVSASDDLASFNCEKNDTPPAPNRQYSNEIVCKPDDFKLSAVTGATSNAKDCLDILTKGNVLSCLAEVIDLKLKLKQPIEDLLNCVANLDTSHENLKGTQKHVKSEMHKTLVNSGVVDKSILVIEPQLTVTCDKKFDLPVPNVSISSQHLHTDSLNDHKVKDLDFSVTSIDGYTDNLVDSYDSCRSKNFLNIDSETINSPSLSVSTVIDVITKDTPDDTYTLTQRKISADLLVPNPLNSTLDDSSLKESHKAPVHDGASSYRRSSSRSMGKLLMDLGLQVVSKQVFRALIGIQKRNLHRNDDATGESRQLLEKLESTHRELIMINLPYRCGRTLRCRCGFGTNSTNVLEHHREYGEEIGYRIYRCCYCKDGDEGDEEFSFPAHLQHHMEAEHDRTFRPTRKWHHQCHYCPFVNNTLGTMITHRRKCMKLFKLSRNLEPIQDDLDIPLVVVGDRSAMDPSCSVKPSIEEVPRGDVKSPHVDQPTKNIPIPPSSTPSGSASAKVPDYVQSQRIRFEIPIRFASQNYNFPDFMLPLVRTNVEPNINFQIPRAPLLQSLLCQPNVSGPILGFPSVLDGASCNFNSPIRNFLMNHPHGIPNLNFGALDTTPTNPVTPNFNYQRPGLSLGPQLGDSLPLLVRYVSALQPGPQPVFGTHGGLSFPNSVSLSNNGGLSFPNSVSLSNNGGLSFPNGISLSNNGGLSFPNGISLSNNGGLSFPNSLYNNSGFMVGQRFPISSASSRSHDMSYHMPQSKTTTQNQFCRPDRPMYSPNQLASMQMCPICQGFVQDSAVMAVHLRLCHPMIGQQRPPPQAPPTPDPPVSQPVFCFACTPPAPFLNQSFLQQHKSLAHSANKADVLISATSASSMAQTMCWFCNTPVVTSLIEHMESKHQLTLWIMLKRHMCYLCPEQLINISAFENHMLITHARLFPALERLWSSIQDSIPFAEVQASGLDFDFGQFGESKCPSCKDVFLNRSFLYRHFFLNHAMNASAKVPLVNRPSVPAKMTKCPFCRLSVIEGEYYFRHLKRVHTRRCTVSVTRLDKRQFDRYHRQYLTRHMSSRGDGSVTSNELTSNVTSHGDRSATINVTSPKGKSVTNNVTSNEDKNVNSSVHLANNDVDVGSRENSVELQKVSSTGSLKVRLDLRKIELETNDCFSSFAKERESMNNSKHCTSDLRVEHIPIFDINDEQGDSSFPRTNFHSPSINKISNVNVEVSPRRKRPKPDDVPLIISDDEETEGEEETTKTTVLQSLLLDSDVDTATALNSKKKNKKNSKRARRVRRSKEILETPEEYSISPLVIEPDNINFNTLNMSPE